MSEIGGKVVDGSAVIFECETGERGRKEVYRSVTKKDAKGK